MKLRPYSKQELARLYFPGIQPHSAVCRLMSWVKADRQLMERLLQVHYSPTTRLLTVRQVELIVRFLGEPDGPERPLPPGKAAAEDESHATSRNVTQSQRPRSGCRIFAPE